MPIYVLKWVFSLYFQSQTESNSTNIDESCAIIFHRRSNLISSGSRDYKIANTTRKLPRMGEKSLRVVGPCHWRLRVRRSCARNNRKVCGKAQSSNKKSQKKRNRCFFVVQSGSECGKNSEWGLRPGCIAGAVKM